MTILNTSAHLLNSYSVLWATGIDRHGPADEGSRAEVMKGRLGAATKLRLEMKRNWPGLMADGEG